MHIRCIGVLDMGLGVSQRQRTSCRYIYNISIDITICITIGIVTNRCVGGQDRSIHGVIGNHLHPGVIAGGIHTARGPRDP